MDVTLPIELSLDLGDLTDEQFFSLCQKNRDFRFERNAAGDLVIMPPTGAETGNRNSDLNYQLCAWNRRTKLGITFDSSTGFKLPNGANRSPDASWLSLDRWESIPLEQRQVFPQICPDFVVELLSPTDQRKRTQGKMQEYLDNGTRLGWLINRKIKQVEIYRQGQTVEVLNAPERLNGEDILPDFELDLTTIW
jgi:Uma2 family endonuclease